MNDSIINVEDTKILFIIVTYNAMRWIDHCLGSIINMSLRHDIFIVDNGSIDGTQDYIKKKYSSIIFVQSEKNLGFGKANNLGFKYAIDNGYDYVYLLNQDAWILPNTVEILVNIHLSNPEYGVLSPLQMQANMLNLDYNFAVGVCSYSSNKHLLSDLCLGNIKEVYDVPYVMAAHWLISRDCFNKVGGFSPSFQQYGEDDNYADRTRYYGFKLGIVPSSKAVHDREARKKTLKHDIYMNCYIYAIRLLSNPLLKKKYRKILHWIKTCVLYTFKHITMTPLLYAFRIIRCYSILRKNKIISMTTDRAFLK